MHPIRRASVLFVPAVFVLAVPTLVLTRGGNDWPQWRGPNRDGR